MKKLIFYAHDPGSYDVVYPVFKEFNSKDLFDCELFCEGPAGKINNKYKSNLGYVVNKVNEYIEKGILLGFISGRNWGIDYELQAINICKKFDIKTFVILDYWNSYVLKLNNSSRDVISPDFYIMMDQIAKNEAIEEGISEKIINILGHPGLDKFVSYNMENNANRETNGKILVISQPLSKIYGDTLGYTEEKVIEDCIKAKNWVNGITLDIKFHPKDDLMFIEKYKKEAIEGDLTEIIPNYDLVIGMSSMGLLHAVLMGNTAISYQPNLRNKDFCITNKLGITPLITKYEDLVTLFENLNNRSVSGNNNILKRYIWSDGKSTKRVCDFINNKLQ